MPDSSPGIQVPSVSIPYGCQTVGQEEINAVISILQSRNLTQGPAIAQFEQSVADYCGVTYAVAFCNGTAALHAACAVAGLKPGDEAIVPPITFVATANAVVYCGAKPVFADIDAQSWNIDPDAVRQAITAQTRAVLPVHFAGQPVDLQAIYSLADQHNLTVIEDACHALGAQYQGKPIGQCRDMAVFSFHPLKSITTGEGGMVVTPHRHFYEALLQFRSHGLTRNTATFTHLQGQPWEYEMQSLGYNYRLTDLQAAMGIAQLQKLPDFMARRQALVNRYRDAFSNHPALQIQARLPGTQSANHLFVVKIHDDQTAATRRRLYDTLAQAGIQSQVHYIPVPAQPYYQTHLKTNPDDYSVSQAYYGGALSLPLYPSLSFSNQNAVINVVLEAL